MKITFLGAGSTVFSKNVLGDCLVSPELDDYEISLYDIDPVRLDDSYRMLGNINQNIGRNVRIGKTLDLELALKGADYIVNAIQVGGYDPATIADFEIPKKYGLRQTIADTLGIGGIFRALRTIPVLEHFAGSIHKNCPNALFINYTNPMAMLTGYMIEELSVNTVGLCHSVQVCVRELFKSLGMTDEYLDTCHQTIAGINHQSWLLKITDKDHNDLYPLIRQRSKDPAYSEAIRWDLVRHEMMHTFGYYNTESSEHTAEYNPYFIKRNYPELIYRFNIPLDEYLRRCISQIGNWSNMRAKLVEDESIQHERTHEFASYIISAIEMDKPYKIHGNVMNTGLITNLPVRACVEVPCMVDRNGVNPCFVGDLPEQCAALNRTNINVQILTRDAAKTRRKEYVYMAAMLDPHTAAELSMDEIRSMCDELMEAHKEFLPEYK